MLAPRDSRSRDCRRLDGLWRFRFDPGGEGTAGRWWQGPLPDAREMAVPASYNDLVTQAAEREHVGDVWYQRDVRVPATWQDRRIVLRCDAATHHGTLWAGDTQVAEHAGGYTPFEAEVTDLVRCGEVLRVTIRVGSELSMATIPATFQDRVTYSRAKPRRSRARRAGSPTAAMGPACQPCPAARPGHNLLFPELSVPLEAAPVPEQ